MNRNTPNITLVKIIGLLKTNAPISHRVLRLKLWPLIPGSRRRRKRTFSDIAASIHKLGGDPVDTEKLAEYLALKECIYDPLLARGRGQLCL
jgi:hypothetical protein